MFHPVVLVFESNVVCPAPVALLQADVPEAEVDLGPPVRRRQHPLATHVGWIVPREVWGDQQLEKKNAWNCK